MTTEVKTKQENILQLIGIGICAFCELRHGTCERDLPCDEVKTAAFESRQQLHSQGVVLKVEHWLPTHSGMVCTVDPLIETGG